MCKLCTIVSFAYPSFILWIHFSIRWNNLESRVCYLCSFIQVSIVNGFIKWAVICCENARDVFYSQRLWRLNLRKSKTNFSPLIWLLFNDLSQIKRVLERRLIKCPDASMPNLTKNNLALNRSDAKRKTWSPVFSCATGSLPVFTLGLHW